MKKVLLAASSTLFVFALLLSACAPAATPTPRPTLPPPPTAAPTGASPLAPTPTAAVARPAPTLAPATPTPTAPAPPPADKPRSGGVLFTVQRGDAPSMDGHQERTMHTQHPLSPVYSLLVQNDPKDENKLIADLAQRWEASPDGKVWTFYLQKGVKFHDGRPATSADVKVSFDRIASPPKGIRSPRAGLFSALERIETPDDQTVKFFLKYPQGGFLTMVASPYNWIYPKHILAEKGDMTKVAVGTGPFKLKDYIRGVSWELVKNADYFVPGRPYLDGILRYIMVDRASMFAAVRTHRIQLSTMLNNETTPAERDILKREAPQIVQKGGTLANPMWLFFNHKRAPWSDVRVRQAVNLAYDRQAAIKVARKGDGTLGAHFLPGSGWEIPEQELLKLPGYRQPKDQDIAEAKRLLAEAGFPQGFKTTMLYWNEALYADQAVFLKDQLV
ncbi:MAG: ABC transporter substrate-binding protein, partial [Chloroflexota bacterium]|nr:ABC transporter substrate-binding protein [Chloroflexota bacterium]